MLVTFLAAPDGLALQESSLSGLGHDEIGTLALEVLDTQSEMVSRWRPDGTILYCNEAFARQCGRALERGDRRQPVRPDPAARDGQIQRNVARLSPALPASGYDHHIPGGPGGERWQEWIDRAFFDEQGRPTSYLSVGRDITARKLAERQLAESERRLKLALEAGRQGVWELRLRHRRHRSTARSRSCCACRRAATSSTSSAPPAPTIPTTGSGSARPSRPWCAARAMPTGSRRGAGPATATGSGC